MRTVLRPLAAAIGLSLTSLAGGEEPRMKPEGPTAASLGSVADGYVKLVLALGRHDPDYVDAYFGPPEWKEESDARILPLERILAEADRLLAGLGTDPPAGAGEEAGIRHRFLRRLLEALRARADMLQGKRLSFDAESRALYDAVAPAHGEDHFRAVLERLEGRLPGEGPAHVRYEEYRKRFAIPPDRVDAVFRAAIAECRRRTEGRIPLPAGESFTVEYVTGKSWSAYNWYQGGYRSLIQVNTDLPIYIDRALDLACHEGYPGHHVFHSLLERHLVRELGWREFTVYPLFSPQSLIAEGTANYGVELAFPRPERARYERETLFPLAGLDPAGADRYYEIQEIVRDLNYAGNEAARRYLDGEIDADAAADWLARYGLHSPERARQRVRFIEQYRAYVINYNLGQDLVRRYVESQAGPGAPAEKKWAVFAGLLSSPRLPSEL